MADKRTPQSDHERRISELEDAIRQISKIAEAVERHERILKGGDNDGEKGLLERVRGIETSINSASSWLRAITLLFVGQFIAVIFGVVSLIVKVLPILLDLAK